MHIFETPFRKFNLPQTENKLLKSSICNCLTYLIITVVVASLVSVYYIFHIFFTPLIWAVLVGTCIFPFKRHLTMLIEGWLKGLEKQNCTLTVGSIVLPINLLLVFGDFVFVVLRKQLKFIVFYVFGLPMLYYIYNIGILSYLFSTISTIYGFTSNIFGSKLASSLVLTSVISFIVFTFVSKDGNRQIKIIISSIIWIVIIMHISSLAGSFGLVVFTGILFLLFTGLMMETSQVNTISISSGDLFKFWEFLTGTFRSFSNKQLEEDDNSKLTMDESDNAETLESSNFTDVITEFGDNDTVITSTPAKHHAPPTSGTFTPICNLISYIFSSSPVTNSGKVNRMFSMSKGGQQSIRRTKSINKSVSEKKLVNKIMMFLFWSQFIVFLGGNLWLLILFVVAGVCFVLKKVWKKLELTTVINSTANWIWNDYMLHWFGDKLDILFPQFVRALFKIILQLDEKIRTILLSSLDMLVSTFVIFSLILATLVLTIFLASQVHKESLHLVALTTNVVNSTVSSELFSWLPKRQDITPFIDSVTQNVYIYGREWISKKVHQVFDTNSYNKARIEESALELWEKLYHRIVENNGTNSSISYTKPIFQRQTSINSLQKNFANMWELMSSIDVLNYDKVSNFVRENLGILSTVLESIWLLLRSNINLALSVVTTVISIVFGGGTFLLNFFVSLLIFLTALFYLLAYSQDRYLPMAALYKLTATPSDSSSKKQTQQDNQGDCNAANNSRSIVLQSLYDSVEHGISSVFAVTLKMACFYGLYTSLTHTMFSVNLVVIPAITAAILAVVPIVGTYWAAVPGMTELIFVNQDYLAAGILFLLHLLPMYTVDTMIYSEIKETGHPYLTGLAIAGGVYWLGLEGAVIGPLMLCSFVILINITKMFLLQDYVSPSSVSCHEDPQATPSHHPMHPVTTNLNSSILQHHHQCLIHDENTSHTEFRTPTSSSVLKKKLTKSQSVDKGVEKFL